MSGLKLNTAPATIPVTVAELRNYAKIDDSIDATLLSDLIYAATDWVEEFTNRALINRSYSLFLDGVTEVDTPLREGIYTGPFSVYYNNKINLPRPPLSSVTVIYYYNDDDTQNTWASSNYYVDSVREPASIVLRDSGTWPTGLRNANGIEVQFVAGYGTATTDVPQAIRSAILQLALHLYENRGDSDALVNQPRIINTLLSPYVVKRYGVSIFEANAGWV